MSGLEDYLGRVNATLWQAADYVSASGREEAQRLVEHGEPAEGMCILAWIIVREGVKVPGGLIKDIRALSEGLVSPGHMPVDLDDHAIVQAE